MSQRYRLFPIAASNLHSPQALLEELGGFSHSPLATLSTHQWTSALKHALDLGANTILLQDAVLDPDFLEEYEAFYSRQQKTVLRFCRRSHFFRTETAIAETDEASEILRFIDSATEGAATYHGFVTIRPLRHAPVGASILSETPGSGVTCKDSFPVHIAGRSFEVLGTPYLQQDNAVGACAQASIWIALRTLRKRVGNSAYSPAELTMAATKHLALDRVFPGRQGLSSAQMLEAIRSAGHDPLIVALDNNLLPQERATQAIDFAVPYLESGLPVILGLENGAGHAVTAIGYRPVQPGAGDPSVLIVHNDNTGCYLDLPMQPISGGYALAQTKVIITPLPEGISITAAEARALGVQATKLAMAMLSGAPAIASGSPSTAVNLTLRTFLSTRHAFRKWAYESNHIDTPTKEFYRTTELPKHIWVIELHSTASFSWGGAPTQSRAGEVILDASADALHGDALLAVRVSALIFGPNFPPDGILYFEDRTGGPKMLAIHAPLADGQAKPWQ